MKGPRGPGSFIHYNLDNAPKYKSYLRKQFAGPRKCHWYVCQLIASDGGSCCVPVTLVSACLYVSVCLAPVTGHFLCVTVTFTPHSVCEHISHKLCVCCKQNCGISGVLIGPRVETTVTATPSDKPNDTSFQVHMIQLYNFTAQLYFKRYNGKVVLVNWGELKESLPLNLLSLEHLLHGQFSIMTAKIVSFSIKNCVANFKSKLAE